MGGKFLVVSFDSLIQLLVNILKYIYKEGLVESQLEV